MLVSELSISVQVITNFLHVRNDELILTEIPTAV